MYCASSRRSKRPSLSRSAPSKMRSAGCCGPSNLSQKLKASWHRRTTGEPQHMPGHLSLWSISGTSCISYVLLDMDDMNDMASHCVSWQMWQVLWKYLRERVRRLSRQDWMLTAFIYIIYIWLFENSWHTIFGFDSQAPLLEDEVPAAGLGTFGGDFLRDLCNVRRPFDTAQWTDLAVTRQNCPNQWRLDAFRSTI